MQLGVVIPTLNEATRIGGRLLEASRVADGPVVVVDGGSSDGTVAIARSFPDVTVLTSPRGRATQMNAGAQVLSNAGADLLLFLHADVSLPADARAWIASVMADPAVVAGAFRTWTVADTEAPWWSPLLHLADLRSRYTTLPYGDQALFVRTSAFQAVGGFPEQPLMEDLELARRLKRLGGIRTAPAFVRVSGRRFLARPILFTLAVNVFPLLYRAGVSPSTLKALYADVR